MDDKKYKSNVAVSGLDTNSKTEKSPNLKL